MAQERGIGRWIISNDPAVPPEGGWILSNDPQVDHIVRSLIPLLIALLRELVARLRLHQLPPAVSSCGVFLW